MCHDPHASSISPLLLAEGLELCGECHEEIAEEMEEAASVHDPAEESCTDCHNPHSGPYDKMLSAEKRAVCDECHDDVVEVAESSEVDHAPTTTGEECVNCHSPHAGAEGNLKQTQTDLCLSCHDEPVESGEDTLIDMKKWLTQNKEWHEPVRENNCTGCHQPHGSANFRLLQEPFPPKFYVSFSVETYALCLSCHDESMLTTRWTRTLTGFRNGNRNLHFLHVNKAKRGRTCRACHEVHSSPYPLHIREKVRYGKWMMPINFKQNETGASCHPGCHKLASYDREAENDPESE
jgi:predicted CXXCH cytochrome family protein